jgi:hypothetical protein
MPPSSTAPHGESIIKSPSSLARLLLRFSLSSQVPASFLSGKIEKIDTTPIGRCSR